MNGLRQLMRATVPRRWRIQTSLALGEIASMRLRHDLARLARGPQPIIVGPWFGEVGFELLYWIPFVAWFTERFQVKPERLVVISRGGVDAWYRHLASRYCDVFDYLSPSDFARAQAARTAELGEQKQTRPTAFERALLDNIRRDLSLGDAKVLHPSAMYRTFRQYWWGHASTPWVHRHARYQRLMTSPAWRDRQPSYIAVKFYFNECFPATAANRAFVADTLSRLTSEDRVISLSTGLQLDDHRACDAELARVERLSGTVEPRNNLAEQTAIVAHARAFIGTYGGFSYLAPFYGVPSTGVYSREDGFSRRHLELARSVFRKFTDRELLSLCAVQSSPASSSVLVQAGPWRGTHAGVPGDVR
jgi:hypothetical protein